MATKDDPLERLYPFLGARRTVRLEVVCASMSDDGKANAILVFIYDAGRYAKPKIYLSVGKVEIRGILIVRENIAFETKPVAVVGRITSSAFREISRFRDNILQSVSVESRFCKEQDLRLF